MTDRPYDVVLYGASGFVGEQTVRYFAQHAPVDRVRWAIAGRNRAKLEAVKRQVSAEVDILVADSQDREAVDRVISQTRVCLNTAGPFALYGNAIVDACVRFQAHYVDITGETPWVKSLIDRYHDRAAAAGTRIVPFCGFDSVPSDLGAYLVARYLQQQFQVPCTQVKAYFQAYGGFNGGTLASGFNLYDSGQVEQFGDPFLLNPSDHFSSEEKKQNRDPQSFEYDSDIDSWIAPFFMGAVNTRVVRRSCGLFEQWQIPDAPDFTYQEYWKCEPPLGWLKAAAITAGMAGVKGLMSQTAIREFLRSYLLEPGKGPSETTMDGGWFRCEVLGFGSEGQKVLGAIADRGDPGNRATVKFLCESALSLASNKDELPGGKERGGILTPATGLGEVLAKRLREAGMKIEVKEVDR